MRRLHFWGLLCLVLAGMHCGKQANGPADVGTVDSQATIGIRDTVVVDRGVPHPTAELLGYYVGYFSLKSSHFEQQGSTNNRITLSIDRLGDLAVEGHTVVAGNLRPFSGSYRIDGTDYHIVADEPGNDKYDGRFSFVLDAVARTVEGEWQAYDTSIAVYRRSYELKYTTFAYDPEISLGGNVESDFLSDANGNIVERNDSSEVLTAAASRYNASTHLLTVDEVANMYKGDLEVMRNAIYARHGYSFRNRRMRYFFDRLDWYVPVSIDVTKELTSIELKNIELIKRYEEHASNYYDKFGR